MIRAWSYIEINLYSHSPWMFCATFGWKCPNGFEKKYYLMCMKYITCFANIFRWINKLEFPSPKNDLCQVWLKLALWFWGIIILNVGDFCCYYLHWEMAWSLNPHHLKMVRANLKFAWCLWKRRLLKIVFSLCLYNPPFPSPHPRTLCARFH